MSIILAFARIPAFIWFLIAGAWSYKVYHDWETGPKVEVEGEISNKRGHITQLDAEIKRAEEFNRLKEEKFRALQEMELKLNEASDQIPRSMDVPSLLKPLADISDKVGLEFSRFKPQPRFNQEFLFVYPVEVELKGTYSQVMSFLDETAHLTRIISTKKLTLDQPQAKGTASLLTARVTLYAYSMDPGSNLGTKGNGP